MTFTILLKCFHYTQKKVSYVWVKFVECPRFLGTQKIICPLLQLRVNLTTGVTADLHINLTGHRMPRLNIISLECVWECFLHEINLVEPVDSIDCPYQSEWSLFNLLKPWIEQKAEENYPFILCYWFCFSGETMSDKWGKVSVCTLPFQICLMRVREVL